MLTSSVAFTFYLRICHLLCYLVILPCYVTLSGYLVMLPYYVTFQCHHPMSNLVLHSCVAFLCSPLMLLSCVSFPCYLFTCYFPMLSSKVTVSCYHLIDRRVFMVSTFVRPSFVHACGTKRPISLKSVVQIYLRRPTLKAIGISV